MNELSVDAEGTGVPEATAPLLLRLLGGWHQGAERSLQDADMVVIGSAADCDVILADDGVAAHHCIVTSSAGSLSLRAMDAAVFVGDRCVAPGERRALPPFLRVVLGSAVFAVGATDAAQWRQLLDAPPPAVERRVRRRRLGATVAALVVMCAAGAGYALLGRPEPPDLGAQQRTLVELLTQLGLHEAQVRLDENGQSVVEGVAPTQASADALREALKVREIPAAVTLRSGDDLAADVREVFRLSGFTVETRYLGDGRVEVRGRLGEEAMLQELIGSRAMREVDGLKQIVAVNHDLPAPPPPHVPADGKRIVTLVPGDDPYVITADGSRYYLGSTLPDGGHLVAIEGRELIVEREGTQERVTIGPQSSESINPQDEQEV